MLSRLVAIVAKRYIFDEHRQSLLVGALCVSLTLSIADAYGFNVNALEPSTLFFQAGIGNQSTHAYIAGTSWNWAWSRQYSWLDAGGFFEGTVGRWTTDDHGISGSIWATQIGVTPVIRLQIASGDANNWFAELGVGANVIVPLYRTGHKRFSTEFNFGDHFGIGRQVGRRREHELTVRMQHFSNAGIKHPNPGENFVQLRYAHRI